MSLWEGLVDDANSYIQNALECTNNPIVDELFAPLVGFECRAKDRETQKQMKGIHEPWCVSRRLSNLSRKVRTIG